MTTLITHPGQAHRDEFLACCLLAAVGHVHRIERRDPTQEELDDPDILVVDVGGRYEPNLGNFDHHQFPRDAEPQCAITLVLSTVLGIEVEQAREIWGWLEFSELLDSKGPFATAAHYGMTPEALFATVSPIETTVLRWFETQSTMWDDSGAHPLWGLMEQIGHEKLSYLRDVQDRLAHLEREAHVTREPREGGLRVADARCIPADDNPTLALEIFCKKIEEDGNGPIAITITMDDRGDGECLFRREDHPGVDFSRCEKSEGVVFAHKGGFVVKTEKDQCPWVLIREALLPAAV